MAYADRIRRGYETFVRGEVEEMLSLLHPDIELHEEPELPGGGVWHGHEGFLSYFKEAGGRWSELSLELNEISALDESTFLASGKLRGTGAMSGAGVETPFCHVFELRDGLAFRMRMFFDRAQALEAAGGGQAVE